MRYYEISINTSGLPHKSSIVYDFHIRTIYNIRIFGHSSYIIRTLLSICVDNNDIFVKRVFIYIKKRNSQEFTGISVKVIAAFYNFQNSSISEEAAASKKYCGALTIFKLSKSFLGIYFFNISRHSSKSLFL